MSSFVLWSDLLWHDLMFEHAYVRQNTEGKHLQRTSQKHLPGGACVFVVCLVVAVLTRLPSFQLRVGYRSCEVFMIGSEANKGTLTLMTIP